MVADVDDGATAPGHVLDLEDQQPDVPGRPHEQLLVVRDARGHLLDAVGHLPAVPFPGEGEAHDRAVVADGRVQLPIAAGKGGRDGSGVGHHALRPRRVVPPGHVGGWILAAQREEPDGREEARARRARDGVVPSAQGPPRRSHRLEGGNRGHALRLLAERSQQEVRLDRRPVRRGQQDGEGLASAIQQWPDVAGTEVELSGRGPHGQVGQEVQGDHLALLLRERPEGGHDHEVLRAELHVVGRARLAGTAAGAQRAPSAAMARGSPSSAAMTRGRPRAGSASGLAARTNASCTTSSASSRSRSRRTAAPGACGSSRRTPRGAGRAPRGRAPAEAEISWSMASFRRG